MRDLVEAARAVVDTVPMHDETCAYQYSPTQPADCCDSSKALAVLRAALAAHEARPAVEWVTKDDVRRSEHITFRATANGCKLEAHRYIDLKSDEPDKVTWRISGALSGNGTARDVEHAKLAAETAAGVGR